MTNHDPQVTAIAVSNRSRERATGQWLLRVLLHVRGGWRGLVAILAFLLLWQALGTGSTLSGKHFPTPIDVTRMFIDTFLGSPGYWKNWAASFERVIYGFGIAQLLGIPLGIALGMSRTTEDLLFPVFEVLRPIPPLAWVPLSILFWPTHESSIIFITFIGAFFVIVLNVFEGIQHIPARYFWLATSLGASRFQIFIRIVLPAVIPSIAVGMTLGIAITWDVLVAAEMIAGDVGLGRLTWEGYVSNTPAIVIIGMISIGIAGYISSRVVDVLERRLMPWAQHDPKLRGRR